MTSPRSPLPPDDITRQLTAADPDDAALPHLAVVGDTYTILISGQQTNGAYALIDMLIPPGGGPPPHRHDFEELFHVLEGRVEVSVRDDHAIAEAGHTVNVPANAPHRFRNPTEHAVRMLCLVSPAGLEEYFALFGDPVATRTSPAPELTDDQRRQRMQTAGDAAPRFGIETL